MLALTIMVAASVNAQLLWKVSGGNTYKPSYLFGTIHLETSAYIDSVPGLRQAINEVDAVYGEILKDSLIGGNTVMKMAKELIAPSDSTIDKLLTTEEYQLVDSVVNNYMMGLIGLDKLTKLKPVALTTQITLMQMAKYFPQFTGTSSGIDASIQDEALKLGKHVDGLETVEDQIRALFGTSLKEQAQELVELCRNDKKFMQYNQELCDAYHAQDLAAIERIVLDKEKGMSDAAMDRSCYDRNRRWMDKITMTLPVQSVLVAVGAAHLVGKDGLIELLRQRGYTVDPVIIK